MDFTYVSGEICPVCLEKEGIERQLVGTGTNKFCPDFDCYYDAQLWSIAKAANDLPKITRLFTRSRERSDDHESDNDVQVIMHKRNPPSNPPDSGNGNSPPEPVNGNNPPEPVNDGGLSEPVKGHGHEPQKDHSPEPLKEQGPPEPANNHSLNDSNMSGPSKDILSRLSSSLFLLFSSESLKNSLSHFKDSTLGQAFLEYSAVRSEWNRQLPEEQKTALKSRLEQCQKQVYGALEAVTPSKRGQWNSPLCAIPRLLKEVGSIEEMFLLKHNWTLVCENCSSKGSNNSFSSKTLISFAKVPQDFSMNKPSTFAVCKKCHAANQKRHLLIDKLPENIILHFQHGLPSNNLENYDFMADDKLYRVKAFIQNAGEGGKKHFTTLVRDFRSNSWSVCGDLDETGHAGRFTEPQEIHIVMWENVDASAVVSPLGVKTRSGQRRKSLTPMKRASAKPRLKRASSQQKNGLFLEIGNHLHPDEECNPQRENQQKLSEQAVAPHHVSSDESVHSLIVVTSSDRSPSPSKSSRLSSSPGGSPVSCLSSPQRNSSSPKKTVTFASALSPKKSARISIASVGTGQKVQNDAGHITDASSPRPPPQSSISASKNVCISISPVGTGQKVRNDAKRASDTSSPPLSSTSDIVLPDFQKSLQSFSPAGSSGKPMAVTSPACKGVLDLRKFQKDVKEPVQKSSSPTKVPSTTVGTLPSGPNFVLLRKAPANSGLPIQAVRLQGIPQQLSGTAVQLVARTSVNAATETVQAVSVSQTSQQALQKSPVNTTVGSSKFRVTEKSYGSDLSLTCIPSTDTLSKDNETHNSAAKNGIGVGTTRQAGAVIEQVVEKIAAMARGTEIHELSPKKGKTSQHPLNAVSTSTAGTGKLIANSKKQKCSIIIPSKQPSKQHAQDVSPAAVVASHNSQKAAENAEGSFNTTSMEVDVHSQGASNRLSETQDSSILCTTSNQESQSLQVASISKSPKKSPRAPKKQNSVTKVTKSSINCQHTEMGHGLEASANCELCKPASKKVKKHSKSSSKNKKEKQAPSSEALQESHTMQNENEEIMESESQGGMPIQEGMSEGFQGQVEAPETQVNKEQETTQEKATENTISAEESDKTLSKNSKSQKKKKSTVFEFQPTDKNLVLQNSPKTYIRKIPKLQQTTVGSAPISPPPAAVSEHRSEVASFPTVIQVQTVRTVVTTSVEDTGGGGGGGGDAGGSAKKSRKRKTVIVGFCNEDGVPAKQAAVADTSEAGARKDINGTVQSINIPGTPIEQPTPNKPDLGGKTGNTGNSERASVPLTFASFSPGKAAVKYEIRPVAPQTQSLVSTPICYPVPKTVTIHATPVEIEKGHICRPLENFLREYLDCKSLRKLEADPSCVLSVRSADGKFMVKFATLMLPQNSSAYNLGRKQNPSVSRIPKAVVTFSPQKRGGSWCSPKIQYSVQREYVPGFFNVKYLGVMLKGEMTGFNENIRNTEETQSKEGDSKVSSGEAGSKTVEVLSSDSSFTKTLTNGLEVSATNVSASEQQTQEQTISYKAAVKSVSTTEGCSIGVMRSVPHTVAETSTTKVIINVQQTPHLSEASEPTAAQSIVTEGGSQVDKTDSSAATAAETSVAECLQETADRSVASEPAAVQDILATESSPIDEMSSDSSAAEMTVSLQETPEQSAISEPASAQDILVMESSPVDEMSSDSSAAEMTVSLQETPEQSATSEPAAAQDILATESSLIDEMSSDSSAAEMTVSLQETPEQSAISEPASAQDILAMESSPVDEMSSDSSAAEMTVSLQETPEQSSTSEPAAAQDILAMGSRPVDEMDSGIETGTSAAAKMIASEQESQHQPSASKTITANGSCIRMLGGSPVVKLVKMKIPQQLLITRVIDISSAEYEILMTGSSKRNPSVSSHRHNTDKPSNSSDNFTERDSAEKHIEMCGLGAEEEIMSPDMEKAAKEAENAVFVPKTVPSAGTLQTLPVLAKRKAPGFRKATGQGVAIDGIKTCGMKTVSSKSAPQIPAVPEKRRRGRPPKNSSASKSNPAKKSEGQASKKFGAKKKRHLDEASVESMSASKSKAEEQQEKSDIPPGLLYTDYVLGSDEQALSDMFKE